MSLTLQSSVVSNGRVGNGLRTSFAGDKVIVGEQCVVLSSSSGSVSSAPGVLRIECKESRIGKAPIDVPTGVTVTLQGQSLAVKGPLGELARTYPAEVKLTRDDSSGKLLVARAVDTRRARQMHGLFRTLTDNMVIGVFKGFEKRLQLVGVGYRAAVEDGILVKVEENTRVAISGRDKCVVGDFAAAIRKWRPPEPYKGKGIKYQNEVIRRKEGKVGKKK